MTPEQRIYAVMFNSIGPALKTAELWAPLFARQRIAESISEALAEQGYAIAPATAPQALEASQGIKPSRDGMTGHLARADSPTGLSDVHMEIADRHGTRRITFPDATPGERLALMRAVELDDLRTELEIARLGQRRAERAEGALEAAQQALSRVIRYARTLNESNPVTADRIAEAILGPGDYAEGAALATLTKEKPCG